MRRLSLLDAGWLMIEAPTRPMHVGGLQLFSLPDDAGPTFVQDLVAHALEHTAIRPPFDQKLARPGGLAGVYHWEPAEVDLTYHVRHLALPQPGRIRELLSLVSRNHQALLDRHRPLWESYLIEGLADGRIALYTKIHHSVLDGVAAMRQLLKAFTDDPARRDLPPPWALPLDAEPGEREPADGGTNPFDAVGRLLGGTVDQTTGALGAIRSMASQVVASIGSDAEVIPYQAPRSMLNVRLTASRRFVAQSYDLERIRQVSKGFDATINDVVLSMCGGALRAYLASHDALPDAPLIAMVPVSIRPDEGGDAGNAISMLLANVGTDLPDPVDRLARVKESMDRGKQRLRSMSRTEIADYGLLLMAPILAGQLSGLSGRARPLYNVVISNVPGPKGTLFWNGVRMEGLYPASLLQDGYALNITQTSYDGSMEFGITADRQALPRVQRLIDHLEDELAALERAAA